MRKAALLLGIALLSGCAAPSMVQSTTQGAAAESESGSAVSAAPLFEETGMLENEDAFFHECRITLGDAISVQGGGALVEGNRIAISEGGVYEIAGTLKGGTIAVDSDDPVKLILNGAAIESDGAAISSGGGKLILESAEGTENFLRGGLDPETDAKAALHAKGTLALRGAGALTIDGGSVKGIKAKKLRFSETDLTVAAKDDAIRVSGEATLDGGRIEISAGKKGVSADGDLTVNDGTVTIRECTEGLESKAVLTVNGGFLSIVSSDDGLNAGGEDGEHTILINGGAAFVNSEGDGLDSNGDIRMTGGTFVIFGPTHDHDGALDCGEGYTITVSGGTLLALGSAGMAQTPRENYLFERIGARAGNVVAVTDESGAERISVAIPKDAQTAVFANGEDPSGLKFSVTPVDVLP